MVCWLALAICTGRRKLVCQAVVIVRVAGVVAPVEVRPSVRLVSRLRVKS
ncbi:MAG: hypothetical protein WC504_06040 [Methylobacter sp.]